jgi:hypothetical protein
MNSLGSLAIFDQQKHTIVMPFLAGAKNSFHPMCTLTFAVIILFPGLLSLLLVAQYIEYTPFHDNCRLAERSCPSKDDPTRSAALEVLATW